MAIQFYCANCQQLLHVGDHVAGKKAKCTKCGTILIVPGSVPVQTAQPAVTPVTPAAASPFPQISGQPAASPLGFEVSDSPRGASSYRKQQAPKTGIVTAVGVINLLVGPVQLLLGIGYFLGGALLGSVARNSGEHGAAAARAVSPFLTAIMILGVLTIVIGASAIISGIGILQRRHWGRTTSLILGGLATLAALASIGLLVSGLSTRVGSIVINAGYAIFIFAVLLDGRRAREFR